MEEYKTLGFNMIHDFISLEEEVEIMNHIERKIQRKTKERNSIQRFGNAPYKDNILSKQIPNFLDKLCEKLVTQNLVISKPSSVSINQYLKGQSIVPHIDNKESGKVITILSLISSAKMIFSFENKKIVIDLPARSLMQMSGELRDKWKHSVEPVEAERFSIVFRCSD